MIRPDAGKVMAALAKRYAPPSWALLSQVGNGTGYGVSNWADAIAMSLWPSRGLDLHGFEIKVYRNDWLRELKKPEKADAIGAYCDFWWIVTTPEIVNLKTDPVPSTWGLLELKPRGLVQVRAAERARTPEPLDRQMLAAILRRSTEDMTPKSSIAEQLQQRFEDGCATGRMEVDRESGEARARADLKELRENVAKFEAASGVMLGRWDGPSVGRLFKLAQHLDQACAGRAIEDARKLLDDTLKRVLTAQRSLADLRTESCPSGMTGPVVAEIPEGNGGRGSVALLDGGSKC